MKIKILYSPEAINDLDEIWEHIAGELYNSDAAFHTVDKIINNIDLLEETPGIGTPLSSVLEFGSEYRFLISGNYMTFYRESDTSVFIDRIIYSKRDYMHILFPDLFSG